MPMLKVVESCLFCDEHSGDIPLNCFDEATGAFLAVLVECAPVEDIIRLVYEWLEQEGRDTVMIDFVSVTDSHVMITYYS